MIRHLRYMDWLLVISILPILVFGLLTMKSLSGDDYFFNRQLIWIAVGFVAMGLTTAYDWRGLKSSAVILSLYALGIILLVILAVIGFVTRGAQSWFYFGTAAFEPVELVKLFLVLVFAKYFSRRYVEIAMTRHIAISFLYLVIPMTLVFLQPDFGSAAILFFVWLSMLLFSGLRFKQIIVFIATGVLIAVVGWFFLLQPYQKMRIVAFFNPEGDPRGSGYHAIQAMIAVGAGGVWGKGVGYGTQSRLDFLPESETDFMFAAFAEEWGLVGVAALFLSFTLLFWRILRISIRSPDNFSKLFGLGISFLLVSHIAVHVGMNMGLLPVTGIGLPFMSYGGSFLVMLMAALGILESIAIRSSEIKAYEKEEFIGL
ncbi:MAG: rod shape-determining protein RodA [Candidatus Ryanbacteria bacterium RIFCSPHIGHO2_12_FULL_47_12b]|uniref:Rod shape-determining protein RodA n=1 Tax=Candidatus Ryanbacteria bacterium RIFCSPLOWO2_02_FULL_47_14 TaxID=1802129 RepID=A0A1G2GYM4_9BACT|nr:MAG: rod shape-determining protein RodA [Candidatus Ryanbacteria bacterium RIFCSPHIGHO2_01_FULL_48_80]OGZ49959.1 MAG: rod shape-determining protein RodA [Candidatus Ryanbacteria bacterium RIFCSPHIGHO2_02_FULL_47_25]OGZ51617.1 MAG: rod shape-determining protein RodA [Candidatus Ryanbacteria bacterium RIFCSPHIGHO2_12_FULL_47_12b]OGZ55325.1 MAG: rod shape-determining protein RodA [Candidatus Ryanbacteria bacterium RIFCSPLOWO2_02_FULL_47_14]